MVNLALALVKQGELEEARDLYQQAHDIEVELQDNHGIAFALNGLGLVAEEMGNLGEARSCFEQAISLRRGEDTGSLAASLVNLANVLHKQGDLNAALAAYQEGLQLRFDRGEKPGLVEALRGIASLAAATGQVAVATQIKCAVHHARVQLGIRPTETAGMAKRPRSSSGIAGRSRSACRTLSRWLRRCR